MPTPITDEFPYAVRPQRHPALRLLTSFPVACFSCALATDLAYVWTMNMMWAQFSTWLLAVGMAFGVLAAIVGLVVTLRQRDDPRYAFSWPLAIGTVVVLLLALLDNFVHSRDAWTSVMPQGLALSAIVVIAILVTNWLDGARGIRTSGPTYSATPYSGARR